MLKKLLIFSAVLVIVSSLGCGSGSGGDGSNNLTVGLGETIEHAAPSQNGKLRVEWEPVDSAVGYFLYLERDNGEVIFKDEIFPSGCTHRKIEGTTAGICLFEAERDSFGDFSVLRLSAFNELGEGELSVAFGR